MKHIGDFCNARLVGLLLGGALLAGALTAGSGDAQAAAVPTLAVTASGNANWQITYDRGRAPDAARCSVRIGGRSTTPPAQVRTMVLRGATVTPGAHPVRVRCGRSESPTVWIVAPRNQLNDVVTWASNGTAGIFGY
ncbi:MAG: hypothetical protein WAW85_08715 [Gordonia sp. (in: high G+C Gram-positive bacteria)]|uniref:hypothetical protein n=1 Tax=Gordonia sp. (in: high G+C Gram-positive bacteria) TaxID=84139 RepID=UPI003BB6072E